MMIQWCMICNAAPASGILEVLNKDTMENELWPCCNNCVNNIDERDWIDNAL